MVFESLPNTLFPSDLFKGCFVFVNKVNENAKPFFF